MCIQNGIQSATYNGVKTIYLLVQEFLSQWDDNSANIEREKEWELFMRQKKS